jgi:hypothetical protein
MPHKNNDVCNAHDRSREENAQAGAPAQRRTATGLTDA